MERDLLRQSVSYHGGNLLALLTCEQRENPDFKYVAAADLSKTLNQRDTEEASPVLEQFIARKADLLFAASRKTSTPADERPDEPGDAHAVMPPLEQFMEVCVEERRELFYRDVERGDLVIGRINSVRDFVSDTQTPSLMRGLQSKRFKEDDFATAIRKKQSVSWALKWFVYLTFPPINQHNFQLFYLKMHSNVFNSPAYHRNLGSFDLGNCPKLEEEEKLVTAEGLYKRATVLDDTFQEAAEALAKLQLRIQKSLKLKEQEAAKEQEQTKTVETSAEKLRKILKEERRMKKKRKRSTSFSTSSDTSSTTSDDSPPSSRKKPKKRKHKRRRSSRGSKKHKRRVSSCSDKTAEADTEWFPAPANTSASYIDQKQSISKLISEGEQSWGKSRHEDGRGKLDDAIDRSLENVTYGAQPEASRLGRPGVNGQVTDRHRTPSTSEHARNRRDSSSSTQSEYSHRSERHTKEFSSQGRKRSESERGGNEKMDREERNSLTLKKDVPSNLLDIFSQVSEFEKEKMLKK
uniref:Tetratricopeptide repeat domain 14 n=1 Tax=Sinocyclocheilus grahami TaxID=75366 RepID=A0A672SA73_SINGR